MVLDPFMGSGTTPVVAKKLGRNHLGIEIEPYYCALAQRRLEKADEDPSIQGYADGVFWERNTLSEQKKVQAKRSKGSGKEGDTCQESML
jgi:site-specific DNA-methyltransferase (adenine-specific)